MKGVRPVRGLKSFCKANASTVQDAEQYNAPTVHFSREDNETRKNRKKDRVKLPKKTTKRRPSLKRFVRRQETGNPHKPLCQRSRETKSIRSSKSQYNNNDKLYYQNRKRKKARLSSSNNSSNIFLKRVSSAFTKTANSFELRQSVQKVDLKDFNVNVRTWLMSFRFVF